MQLALAQINPTVGDLDGNLNKICDYIGQAKSQDCDLTVFPEMALCGYPPEDLLLKPDFVRAVMRRIDRIAAESKGMTVVVGSIYAEEDLFNAAIVMQDGAIAGIYRKQILPNYGVFDENRYFKPGSCNLLLQLDSVRIGISVCEDIWYSDGPAERQASDGTASLLINISASPYHIGKGGIRHEMLSTRAKNSNAHIAYCNMVGGQDELIFDGQSMIFSQSGDLLARAKQFQEHLLIADIEPATHKAKSIPKSDSEFQTVDLNPTPFKKKVPNSSVHIEENLTEADEVYQALLLGTRDYVRKNGFSQVHIGLSGGIDSTLVAAVAADAIGADNVTGVAMPTRYSSQHSLDDAKLLATNLGINFRVIPIDDSFQSFLDMLQPVFDGREPDVTEENIQSRIRGVVLMALSNKFGSLVLTTGNKSETGVGYSTLYGDTAGGFAVIKDVPKLLVYELCRYRNRIAGREVIPESVLTKPPSAELRPDQKDSDSLPDYDILDPIIRSYVEQSLDIREIVSQGYDEETVRRIIRMVDHNEYKRRQSPPGIKITTRAFGKDWRVPITNRYSQL